MTEKTKGKYAEFKSSSLTNKQIPDYFKAYKNSKTILTKRIRVNIHTRLALNLPSVFLSRTNRGSKCIMFYLSKLNLFWNSTSIKLPFSLHTP